MKFSHLLSFGLSMLVAVSHVQAQSVDAKTRDVLIQKLTQVYVNLAPSDTSKVSVTLRLADLLAERARIDAMNELASGCVTCTAGREDRLKALSYYREVLDQVPEASIGKVLTQMGHLYEMVGNEKEAVATYEKILKDPKTPEVRAEAHLSLAEVYFRRRDHARARPHFAKVLDIPQAGSKGLAAYRMAWCDFNDGKLETAIDGLVGILRSSSLLSRSSSSGVIQVDRQFHEEVSRDLATFLARRPMSQKEAELVFELSPESARINNIVYLANEAERLGQVTAAINFWRFAQERQAKPQARVEGHIRLAQLQMEQKLREAAVRDFEMALGLWPQLGNCGEADCHEMKARLRKFVVDWNRIEKKSPSEELLAAYRTYLKVFPTEADMNIWAGQVAADVKNYAVSLELYLLGARLTKEELVKNSGDKEAIDRLEAGLLGAIEAAELSKEPRLLHAAYDSYLGMSRNRAKFLEVQYQKARLFYDAGEYGPAAEALRSVALANEKGGLDVKKQAADLSLDALVLLKDDQRLEAWAADYAGIFTKDAREFSTIARKSVLTQAVAQAEAGEAGMRQAWATLSRFDVGAASAEEKTAFHKNKLILAEKMKKFPEAREAVEALLRQPGLSSEDTRYALSRKAWLAELVLDFDTALAATEKISGGDLIGGQKWLKLAMYAELAAKDPKPFYSQFLKDSKDDEKNAAIAAQMVRESKEPLKEIEKNMSLLVKKPELLGDLYLETYGRALTGQIAVGQQTSGDIAKRAVALPSVSKTAAGKVLARVLALQDYGRLKTRIEAHQLETQTQRKMAATLKARVAMLDEIEKLAAKAIDSADWTTQLVTLDLLAKQNERFYQEVLALPVPEGLSDEDEQQYLMLLSQQAAPHQIRANDVSQKVTEFWMNEKALGQLDDSMKVETGVRRALLLTEVKFLVETAPEGNKTRLAALAALPERSAETPALVVIEGARQAVRENPLSRERIEKLLVLEKQMGRAPMVAYLEGRLATLEQDGGAR
jgi:tetratricopeptide (TPR) repeat protein